MAHSREARVPFLDHRLVELAASLPVELKLAGGETKVVLRRALADLLPREILERRDKLGFATPEAAWLRGDPRGVVDETIATASADGLLDRDAVAALRDRFARGDDGAAGALWRIVCFERWRSLLGVS
jgi:asparagine synthase (glutamine-hydrolysing)